MNRLVYCGVVLGLIALSASEAKAQQRITIDACNGVDVSAVDRILDLEYRDSGEGPLLVGLRCEGDNLTLRVRRNNSAERVLVVDLSAVLSVAKPRTVALLIVELSNELVAGLIPGSAPIATVPTPASVATPPAPLTRELEAAIPEHAPLPATSPVEQAEMPSVVSTPELYAPSAAPGSDPVASLLASELKDNETKKSKVALSSPRLSGAIGYSMLSQNFSTPDTCTMCNYSIEIGAPSANLGAKISGRLGPRYVFVADVDYQYAESQLHMVNEYAPFGVETGYQHHRFRAGAWAGYEIDKPSAIAAYARAGVNHERFIIENSDFTSNAAKLPSELLSGITLGTTLEFAKLTSQTSLGLSADLLVLGRIDQTEGLSDGLSNSTRAVYLGAKLDYQWTSSLNFTWNYKYGQQRTQWQGVDPTSMRDHDGGYAARSDHLHALFAGVSKSI